MLNLKYLISHLLGWLALGKPNINGKNRKEETLKLVNSLEMVCSLKKTGPSGLSYRLSFLFGLAWGRGKSSLSPFYTFVEQHSVRYYYSMSGFRFSARLPCWTSKSMWILYMMEIGKHSLVCSYSFLNLFLLCPGVQREHSVWSNLTRSNHLRSRRVRLS